MAVVVVSRALLRVGQNGISFGSFLELFFCVLVVGVAVGMVLQRELAVGALQLGVIGADGRRPELRSNRVSSRWNQACQLFKARTATFTMEGRSSLPLNL